MAARGRRLARFETTTSHAASSPNRCCGASDALRRSTIKRGFSDRMDNKPDATSSLCVPLRSAREAQFRDRGPWHGDVRAVRWSTRRSHRRTDGQCVIAHCISIFTRPINVPMSPIPGPYVAMDSTNDPLRMAIGRLLDRSNKTLSTDGVLPVDHHRKPPDGTRRRCSPRPPQGKATRLGVPSWRVSPVNRPSRSYHAGAAKYKTRCGSPPSHLGLGRPRATPPSSRRRRSTGSSRPNAS